LISVEPGLPGQLGKNEAIWWPGAEWNAGFASSHGVRLSPLRGSVELPTRGFSVISYFCLPSSRFI